LAARVDAVALSFAKTLGLPEGAKATLTGNPPRAIVLAQKAARYEAPKGFGPFNLVVFGGSQGAKFFSDFMPQVFAAMDGPHRKRLVLTQQCRAEDLAQAQQHLAGLGVNATVAPFFNNMPQLLASSHLVVCRSGATTVAELGVIGRPAVFVPLPHAIDNDQLRNAQSFAGAGGGWVFPQKELQPAEFAGFLTRLMDNGATLMKAAGDALLQGVPDAPEKLADLVESLIRAKIIGVKA
jgi:UDP-N-acetylglucosamine--N-acetylmuramyl-(pentapeptide) pyrophosphoryl-undecaprenol N-acetylglucosamine transferase